jgi:hypothetical protein
VLVEDPNSRIWQGHYSPDGRWLSFVAEPLDRRASVRLAVVPAHGGLRPAWRDIAQDHEWPDKPRWSPDGRTIYFLSRHRSSFFNLWGNRFDPERGTAVGEAFMITHFDNPGFTIWSDMAAGSALDIAAGRVLFTMATVTGSIWMLDNVDK